MFKIDGYNLELFSNIGVEHMKRVVVFDDFIWLAEGSSFDDFAE